MRRALVCMFVSAAMAWAEVKTQRRAFMGWDGAIVMSNGTVELVVVPQLAARVFSYKLAGGDELIYTVPDAIRKQLEPGPWPRPLQWHLGGDKVWPMVKDEFPPDPYIDGAQFEAKIDKDDTVTLTGPLSPKYQVRSWRRIALDPTGSRVTIDNRFRCEGSYAKPMATWTVTQIRTPDFVLADIAQDAPMRDVTRLSQDEPRVLWKDVSPGVIRYDAALAVTDDKPNKIGVYGRWLAALKGDVALVQTAELDPKQTYQDGANIEFYACPRYYEVEVLGPSIKPQPGREIGHRVIWQILPVDRRRSDQEIAAEIAKRAATP